MKDSLFIEEDPVISQAGFTVAKESPKHSSILGFGGLKLRKRHQPGASIEVHQPTGDGAASFNSTSAASRSSKRSRLLDYQLSASKGGRKLLNKTGDAESGTTPARNDRAFSLPPIRAPSAKGTSPGALSTELFARPNDNV